MEIIIIIQLTFSTIQTPFSGLLIKNSGKQMNIEFLFG